MMVILKIILVFVTLVELGDATKAYEDEKPDKMVLALGYAIVFAILAISL